MLEKLELQLYGILITSSLQLKAVDLVIAKHEAAFPTSGFRNFQYQSRISDEMQAC